MFEASSATHSQELEDRKLEMMRLWAWISAFPQRFQSFFVGFQGLNPSKIMPLQGGEFQTKGATSGQRFKRHATRSYNVL